MKKFKIWKYFKMIFPEYPKSLLKLMQLLSFFSHQVRTLQICLYWLKSAKKTHLFRLIHETDCCNEKLYYLFQYWALKINYRALRPLFSSYKQRLISRTFLLCKRWWTKIYLRGYANICLFRLAKSHKINIGWFWIFQLCSNEYTIFWRKTKQALCLQWH